jgi:hypothetical protein
MGGMVIFKIPRLYAPSSRAVGAGLCDETRASEVCIVLILITGKYFFLVVLIYQIIWVILLQFSVLLIYISEKYEIISHKLNLRLLVASIVYITPKVLYLYVF